MAPNGARTAAFGVCRTRRQTCARGRDRDRGERARASWVAPAARSRRTAGLSTSPQQWGVGPDPHQSLSGFAGQGGQQRPAGARTPAGCARRCHFLCQQTSASRHVELQDFFSSVRVKGGRSVPAGRSSGTLKEARWRRQTASCRGLNSRAMPPASAPHFSEPPPVFTAVLDRQRAPREAFGASRKRRGVGWFHPTPRGGAGACARCNCRFVDARKRPLESE